MLCKLEDFLLSDGFYVRKFLTILIYTWTQICCYQFNVQNLTPVNLDLNWWTGWD